MAGNERSTWLLVHLAFLMCLRHSAGQSDDRSLSTDSIQSTHLLSSMVPLDDVQSTATQTIYLSSAMVSPTPSVPPDHLESTSTVATEKTSRTQPDIATDESLNTSVRVLPEDTSAVLSTRVLPLEFSSILITHVQSHGPGTTSSPHVHLSSPSTILPTRVHSSSPIYTSSFTSPTFRSSIIPSSSVTVPFSSIDLSGSGTGFTESDTVLPSSTTKIRVTMLGPCGLSNTVQSELQMSVMDAFSNVTGNRTVIESTDCHSRVQFVLEIPSEHTKDLTKLLEHWKHDGFRLEDLSSNDPVTTIPPHVREPEESMVIYIVIGSLFGLILFIMAIILCVKCYRITPVKKASTPRLNLRLEDYAITRIPRPRTIYTDYCRRPPTPEGTAGLGLVQPFDTSVIPLEDAKKLDQGPPVLTPFPPPPPPPVTGGEMRTFGTSRSRFAEMQNGHSVELPNGLPSVSRERLMVSFEQGRSNNGVDNPLYDVQ